MSHYYINDDSLKSALKTIKVNIENETFTFKTDSGVFSRDGLDFGSRLLIENVFIDENVKMVADVGSGYGPIGIILSKKHPHIKTHMFDVNKKAIELSRENAVLNSVSNVEIKENNILENISDMFDVIVTNPPIRAGKKTVFQVYEQSYERLNKDGVLYVVIQRKQGAPSSFNKLSELFEKVRILTKSKGYWIIKAQK